MSRRKKNVWTNVKGEIADRSLIPPDLKQCQAMPNVLKWSPFTLGPMPKPVQCLNVPVAVLVENKSAQPDGKIGSMSVCNDCLELFRKYRTPTFAKVHELQTEEAKKAFTSGGQGAIIAE